MIACKQLTVHQGSFTLGPIDFTVATGEHVALMGSTGCGKTTLIEAICGLRPTHAGQVCVAERDVTSLDPARRGVGYVPQDGALFPTMTVHDQIAFGLTIRKVAKRQARERAAAIAADLGIDHLLPRQVVGLSGGERQRVALGRALAIEPAILLLDEPLSALDEDRRDEMIDLLKRLRADANARADAQANRQPLTILHITHSRSEAEALADRILRLDAGQLIDPAPAKPPADQPIEESS